VRIILVLLLFLIVLIAGCVQQEQKCGIEQCHGLELTCGSNVPDACTEIYQLGDFCRQYFSGCEVVDGDCAKVSNASADLLFSKCKFYIEHCEKISDPIKAFQCEEGIRIVMKTVCESDEDCACGKDKETGECFLGNKEFVDTSQQCPDFCTGIGGDYEVICGSLNECIWVQKYECRGTAGCFDGIVTEVIDGDTVKVGDTVVRLALVDAPEYYEELGDLAKDGIEFICPVESKVTVDEDDNQTGGSYDRTVGVVYCKEMETNLNEYLVEYGYAEIDERFCEVSEFADEEWTGC
jgi:hypothetical protein